MNMGNNKYTIPAKPTKYKGRLYRSRLEARVAALFDLLKWDYEYEPMDLKKWSPDFLVKTSNGRKFLVEVKPDADYFKISKYLDMDFSEYELMCFSPDRTIIIGDREITSIETDSDPRWIEAANIIMFHKPE